MLQRSDRMSESWHGKQFIGPQKKRQIKDEANLQDDIRNRSIVDGIPRTPFTFFFSSSHMAVGGHFLWINQSFLLKARSQGPTNAGESKNNSKKDTKNFHDIGSQEQR